MYKINSIYSFNVCLSVGLYDCSFVILISVRVTYNQNFALFWKPAYLKSIENEVLDHSKQRLAGIPGCDVNLDDALLAMHMYRCRLSGVIFRIRCGTVLI